MIDFKEFYAAAKLVDPDVLVSFGRKWVYLTPTGKYTRDMYEPYCSVMRTYGLDPRPTDPKLGYQVWALRGNIQGAPPWKQAGLGRSRLEARVRETINIIGWVQEFWELDNRLDRALGGGKPLTVIMSSRHSNLLSMLSAKGVL